MDVSVIFVNYRTKELTINAIKSVIKHTSNLSYEIFVVDNNSQDGSIEAVEQEFPTIHIIKNPKNVGFGAANNIAIRQAKGKYILCLNTDTLLINNAINILFDFMENPQNSNTAVCGGFIYDINMTPADCGGNFPSLREILWKFGMRKIFKSTYKKLKVTLKSDEIETDNNIDYITGADLFVRKSILDEVGLFDERFFMYFEETDLCKRIKNKKYDIKFVPEAKIQHLIHGSAQNTLKTLKLMKKSEFIYFNKNYPHQEFIVKLAYAILYFFSGIKKQNRELLKLILKGCKNSK